MKITSNTNHSPLTGIAGGQRTETGPAGQAPQKTGGSSASVDLSTAARHLSAMQDSSQDIQTQRVQQIRDALASGELRIDPARIADGLLASVRDLLK